MKVLIRALAMIWRCDRRSFVRRVALARQLYGDAQVMLFDEPMAWLDRESRERLDATIEALKKEGKVIILIRHV